jgi:O-succinylhomoserine sulfhydrylase
MTLRVKAQSAAAADIADFLAAHPKITRVIYPHRKDHPDYELAKRQMKAGSNLVSFEIGADKSGVFRFMNALKIVLISNNLGDTKSLITHPATTTHHRIGPVKRAELGIGESLVRVSIGLEDVDDLKDDLTHALKAAG